MLERASTLGTQQPRPRGYRDGRSRRAKRLILGSALVLAFLLLGTFLFVRAFRLEIVPNSGVVIAIMPWNHVILICSDQGCYALSPT
jgi:hypothetical protein